MVLVVSKRLRKIFTSCGKYLSATVGSLIKMYSASVGLQQHLGLKLLDTSIQVCCIHITIRSV